MSPMRSRPNARAAIGLGLLSVISAACVSPDDPGVGIASFQADLVFGIDLPEETTDPLLPNQAPATAVPAAFTTGNSGLVLPSSAPGPAPRGFTNTIPERFRNLPLGPGVGSGEVAECPPAGLSASPAEVAPENVSAPPPEGLFRWKREGTQTVQAEGADPFPVPISGFENRLVREVRTISAPRPSSDADEPVVDGKQFDFEVVQPLLGGDGVLVSSYRVKPRAATGGANVLIGNPVRTGEADRGVALVSIQQFDGDGNSVPGGSFFPSSPVLLLPLPVQAGEEFRSVAVDARSGKTLVHTGLVTRRQSVDACGTLVDGWLVTATQSFSGASPSERELEYVVATGTGLGGMVVSERVDEQAPTVSLDALFTIGQVEPSLLPAPETEG